MVPSSNVITFCSLSLAMSLYPSLILLIYLFRCLVQFKRFGFVRMHYFMIRLSVSRSWWPIKGDVVFSCLSFGEIHIAAAAMCMCVCITLDVYFKVETTKTNCFFISSGWHGNDDAFYEKNRNRDRVCDGKCMDAMKCDIGWNQVENAVAYLI